MSVALKADFISPELYLEAEEKSGTRHEYVDGVVYAMAGGSDAHNLITGAFYVALRQWLRDGPCRVFMADVKLRIRSGQGEKFYYPDVLVTCDPRDTNRLYKEFPRLVIEVLSESTERTDRFEKFLSYNQLESLEEYIHAAQDKVEVVIYRRRNGWKREVLNSLDATLRLESVDLDIKIRHLYEGINREGWK
jgi:Uma2 family endonuclease